MTGAGQSMKKCFRNFHFSQYAKSIWVLFDTSEKNTSLTTILRASFSDIVMKFENESIILEKNKKLTY